MPEGSGLGKPAKILLMRFFRDTLEEVYPVKQKEAQTSPFN